MREKTILQGLGYMMGFGVRVSEGNGDFREPSCVPGCTQLPTSPFLKD
jgi:hypothetical protein